MTGLRFGEDLLEIFALGGHAGEDVIARAIDDAVDERELVGDEAFPERFDDRDAAADTGFIENVGGILGCRRENFFAVMR